MAQTLQVCDRFRSLGLAGSELALRSRWAEDVCSLVEAWIRKLEPTLVLITCHSLDELLKSVRYWGCTVLDLDAQALVDILAVRWHIETFFEYDKDLLGSDHYQLMTTQAILRFWTLTACLMCFLEELLATSKPHLNTCGDARRKIQDVHRRNLLIWLKEQF